MNEFTKGEWQTVFFKGMHEQELYVKVSGGACICKILDVPLVQKKANARLIAAAPKLLAACEMANQIDAVDNGALYQEWKNEVPGCPLMIIDREIYGAPEEFPPGCEPAPSGARWCRKNKAPTWDG